MSRKFKKCLKIAIKFKKCTHKRSNYVQKRLEITKNVYRNDQMFSKMFKNSKKLSIKMFQNDEKCKKYIKKSI